jgi:AraC-like DNA-binding protein
LQVAYAERTTSVPGTVLWCRDVGPTPERTRILPDGCLDLIWDGRRLFVAGPDKMARWHQSPAGTSYVALRFSGGTGPAMLGVPADHLVDLTPGLEELWPDGEAQTLADQVAADPVATLERWAVERSASRKVDPLGPSVLDMAAAGVPVVAMADELGLSTRQLDRRCLEAFGYGPRRLTRVLRFGRAMDEARIGAALAQVAAGCGYADQAHLSREVRALAGTTPGGLLAELRGR